MGEATDRLFRALPDDVKCALFSVMRLTEKGAQLYDELLQSMREDIEQLEAKPVVIVSIRRRLSIRGDSVCFVNVSLDDAATTHRMLSDESMRPAFTNLFDQLLSHEADPHEVPVLLRCELPPYTGVIGQQLPWSSNECRWRCVKTTIDST